MKLGDLVRDEITGFEGIAIAQVNWFDGRTSYYVQPRGLFEGEPIPAQNLNSTQLTVIQEQALTNTGNSRTAAAKAGARS